MDTNDSEDKLKVDQAMVDHNDDVEDYYDDKSGSNDKSLIMKILLMIML